MHNTQRDWLSSKVTRSARGAHWKVGLMVAAVWSAAVGGVAALDPSASDPKAIVEAMTKAQLAAGRTISRVKMTIHDKGGDRERMFSIRTKRSSDTNKMLVLIESPADMRDTGYLSVSYSEGSRANEQWIYLPKLHRVSRIAGSGRSDSFAGSDFTIADLAFDYKAEDFVLKIVDPAAKVGNEDCWLIESTPKNPKVQSESGYERTQLWISKSKLLLLQLKGTLPGGAKTKYLKITDVRSLGGVWTPYKIQMRTLEGTSPLSETVIEYLTIDNNATQVSDTDFTQQRLEQGA